MSSEQRPTKTNKQDIKHQRHLCLQIMVNYNYNYNVNISYIECFKGPLNCPLTKRCINDRRREITSAKIISKGRFGEHDSGQGIDKKEAMFQATALMKFTCCTCCCFQDSTLCRTCHTSSGCEMLLASLSPNWMKGEEKLCSSPPQGWFQVHDTL